MLLHLYGWRRSFDNQKNGGTLFGLSRSGFAKIKNAASIELAVFFILVILPGLKIFLVNVGQSRLR